MPDDLTVNTGARATWFTDDQFADTSNVVLGQGSTLDLNGQIDLIGTLAATSAAVDLGVARLRLAAMSATTA